MKFNTSLWSVNSIIQSQHQQLISTDWLSGFCPCLSPLWTLVRYPNSKPGMGIGFADPTWLHGFSLFGVFLPRLKPKFLHCLLYKSFRFRNSFQLSSLPLWSLVFSNHSILAYFTSGILYSPHAFDFSSFLCEVVSAKYTYENMSSVHSQAAYFLKWPKEKIFLRVF